jgi:hypothetical protein
MHRIHREESPSLDDDPDLKLKHGFFALPSRAFSLPRSGARWRQSVKSTEVWRMAPVLGRPLLPLEQGASRSGTAKRGERRRGGQERGQ